jgi:hypothetical protein
MVSKKLTTKERKQREKQKLYNQRCAARRVVLTDKEKEIVEHLRETGMLPKEAVVHSDINAHRLRQRHEELTQKYEALIGENESLNKQLSLMIDFKDATENRRASITIPGKYTRQTGNATAIFVASDWHLEERVDPSTVNNRNKYDLREAEKRAKNFFRKSLFLTDVVRRGIRIDQAVLAILGDIISGYIHDEFIESNLLSPTQAVLFGTEIICSGIDFLLREGKFEKLYIPCCVGNHGRTIPNRHVVSTAYKNNYEWLMYKFIERFYKKNSRVKFFVENGYHVYMNLYNEYKLRFHHGDSIKYNGGVGGITVPVNKAIAQWNRHNPVYYDVFGHFHQSLDGGFWVSNGSLVGWNAYALSIKANYEEPQQTFMVIDQVRGKIFVAPIFVVDSAVH